MNFKIKTILLLLLIVVFCCIVQSNSQRFGGRERGGGRGSNRDNNEDNADDDGNRGRFNRRDGMKNQRRGGGFDGRGPPGPPGRLSRNMNGSDDMMEQSNRRNFEKPNRGNDYE